MFSNLKYPKMFFMLLKVYYFLFVPHIQNDIGKRLSKSFKSLQMLFRTELKCSPVKIKYRFSVTYISLVGGSRYIQYTYI